MLRKHHRRLDGIGAGIVSGASDNDPTTVATLAVIGSTTIYGLAWLVLLIIPMLVTVQTISSQVGAVSRRGLEDCIRARFGRGWALVALITVLAVNVVTLAADLEGGGAALKLLTGIPYSWWLGPLALAVALILILGNERLLEGVLKYIALIFLAYVVAAFMAHPNWGRVIHDSFVPQFRYTPAYVAGAIALLGTTLTSYAYVWETIEISDERPPLRRLGLVQAGAGLGMIIAGLTFWFIVIATGATLGVAHHPVETAEDAAQALAPIAGRYASIVFAVGLFGSALLAVPVLAGTSAYVMAEMFGWRKSLDLTFAKAPKFYIALISSLLAALGICLLRIPPIKLLFVSGIIGGIATPVTLVLMLLVARDPKVMGKHRIAGGLALCGWVVAAVVVLASAVFLFQTFTGGG